MQAFSPVRVKICGITSAEQALMVQRAGADALGLVIYPDSPRHIDIQRAVEIRAKVNAAVLCIVLLVNPSEQAVRQVIERVKPDLLQFHGDESPEFCQQFNFPFIRAIRMREAVDIEAEVSAYRAEGGFLFDAWSDRQYGGTGRQFDWRRLPSARDYPLILAGGLTPKNVASAVQAVRPDMVDVSGGVESAPGIKEAAKVADFIRNAKRVNSA